MSIVRDRLRKTIASATSLLNIRGKCGKDVLQPAVAAKLNAAGFVADLEDSRSLLGSGLPVWRSKDNGEIEPTRARRLVDIVVYEQDKLVALIETESDLNDLRATGVTKRNGHYDVWSIAKSPSGQFFDSYKSLQGRSVPSGRTGRQTITPWLSACFWLVASAGRWTTPSWHPA